MSVSRISPAFRTGLSSRATLFHPKSQRRWARVHDVRFLATHRDPDRILEKYQDKLDRKAKDKGLKNIDELREAYKEEINNLRRRAAVPRSTAPEPSATTSPTQGAPTKASSASLFDPPPPPPQPLSDNSSSNQAPTEKPGPISKQPPGIKTLSSYLDVPKILTLPEKEISTLWRLRHASAPTSLSATVPLSTYNRIETTARSHPQFILPLPREGVGAEIHFLQWTFPTPSTATVLFTHLAEYKLRGEYATPHTTVTHHLDLAEPKGLVLVRGDVVENRGVTVDEGKWLLMCLQKFYGAFEGGEEGKRKRLLEQFSHGDGNFRIEELLEEAEKI
ncbi:MAG: hypothetical protein M1837_006542 [Sclerophora amabilis]|nr:MAG: hypothetical protein M1837_006542 [Sclerophora amabilis]